MNEKLFESGMEFFCIVPVYFCSAAWEKAAQELFPSSIEMLQFVNTTSPRRTACVFSMQIVYKGR